MFQSLVVTLREGVEAALLIGIALAYLRKSGRPEMARIVYLALAAAVAASVGGAVLLQHIAVSEDAIEGWVLLAAAFFVATLIFWMQRTARGLKQRIEQRLEAISSRDGASAWGLFLFVFLMVFREGIETVLMLSAVSFNTSDLLNLVGAVAGLALAVVFGILFVRGSLRLDLRRFFHITAVILFCVAVQLLISGLHELSESGVLPSSRWEMAVIGPIVSNEVFFFVTILVLAAWMILFDWRSRQSIANSAVDTSSAAELRRQRWMRQRERLWTAAVCACSFTFILLVTAEYLYAKNQNALSPAVSVSAVDGDVRIPISSVSDGVLHRFLYQGTEGSSRFIVVWTGQRLATALDACSICGSKGYSQNGASIVCKNCSSSIYTPTIGLTGGCNPIPVASKRDGNDLVIRVSDLAAGSSLFHPSE